MSKHPRLSRASQRNHHPSPDAEPEYEIGYGRPPMHSRFKVGQSGNPKGRPKPQRNLRTVVEEALNQRITVREGNRTRSLSKLHGMVLTMINAALKSDAKAWASLIILLRSLGMAGEPAETTNRGPLTADDEALLTDYVKRQMLDVQQDDSEEDASDAIATGTPRPDRRAIE